MTADPAKPNQSPTPSEATKLNESPTEATKLNKLPIEATKVNESPIEATKLNESTIEATKLYESPIEAQTNDQSPITVTNTNLPVMVGPNEAQTAANTRAWAVNYKDFYQGKIAREKLQMKTRLHTLFYIQL